MTTRTLNLGEALYLDLRHIGLVEAYRRIANGVGAIYGSKNTFGKFTDYETIDDASEIDRFRLWLLITAIEKNPEEYGVGDADVPEHLDAEALRKTLRYAPRDLNPEPTDYGRTTTRSLARPRNRAGQTGPRGRTR